ncbi:MAG TPA: NAD(P)-dependent alcohol dehydrogenase [Pirellulaceae bacterium]|nr:NAD(P)-dependent alcohol dehydrogenase [Pirellulaceae bacterium]
MIETRSWAARSQSGKFEPASFTPGPSGPEEVEIAVEYCGICHSDLSMLDNAWNMTQYPFVGGHEVIGRVVEVGPQVRGLKLGDRVGVGWNAASCLHCQVCLCGEQQLCSSAQGTIVSRHGGFAERVRAHWLWAIPIPPELDPSAAGPLLCGGITVFEPFLKFDVLPTHRVAVVGIGGLGHMAVKFARAWGCEVVALSSSESKFDEVRAMGAHRVLSSRDPSAIKSLRGSLDLIIVTVNVPMNWETLIAALAPQGRLHVVGAVLEPMEISAFSLIGGMKQVSGSPTGSRSDIDEMLRFAARHQILPQVEHFPMSKINQAFDHLRAGKARYRIVLDADF